LAKPQSEQNLDVILSNFAPHLVQEGMSEDKAAFTESGPFFCRDNMNKS